MINEEARGLRLHLGCGPHVVRGWENVDKSPSVLLARTPRIRALLLRGNILTETQARGFPRGIRYADVTRKLPYPTASASFIYSSHLIEHLSRWQALGFVRECARVLSPGAVMRIATPDLNAMASAYLAGTSAPAHGCATPADLFMATINPFHVTPGNAVQRFVRRNFSGAIHQWLYDADSLTQLLSEGGLPGAQERTFRQGETPDLEIIETRSESLFMEVRAPGTVGSA